VRIKYIIPFAMDEASVANRDRLIPRDILGDDTSVECVPVRNHPRDGASYYETALFDMYVTEAGLRAEAEGYDAVVMDSTTDSGLYALRSRLSIPVFGPGQVAYMVATLLGKRFSIVCYLDVHRHFYEKGLETYHLTERCASIRTAGIQPDYETLFGEHADEGFVALTETARRAIEEDGADVIILGSTTMGQAEAYMRERLPVPVVNPGRVAIKITEAIVQLGLSHSKVGFPSPSEVQDEKWFSLVGVEQGQDQVV
jgi:Asp/Glu/hydantoin racemase